MATAPSGVGLGMKAPDFSLPGVDGRIVALADAKGVNGTVVVFICNHCPYVKAVAGRLVEDARTLAAEGVAVLAINANDAAAYPADSFEAMKAFSAEYALPFPYLHDESQDVARAYGAVCTPDFFGFDRDLTLRYRGRLDEGRTTPPSPGARRDLVEAMREIVSTGLGPETQQSSMGCSIKWKAETTG